MQKKLLSLKFSTLTLDFTMLNFSMKPGLHLVLVCCSSLWRTCLCPCLNIHINYWILNTFFPHLSKNFSVAGIFSPKHFQLFHTNILWPRLSPLCWPWSFSNQFFFSKSVIGTYIITRSRKSFPKCIIIIASGNHRPYLREATIAEFYLFCFLGLFNYFRCFSSLTTAMLKQRLRSSKSTPEHYSL